MEAPTAPLDLAEQDLAVAQLDYIALVSEGRDRDTWKAAVLEWHCAAVAKARAEARIPGMALARDPRVQEVLARLSDDQIGVMLRHLMTENLKLRRDLVNALSRIHLHQRDSTDSGERSVPTDLPAS